MLPNLRLMFGGGVLDQFDVKFITFREFAEENLDDYKSLILVGIRDISTGLQEKLNAHLQQGKSILYFPGKEINEKNINNFFRGLGIGTFGTALVSENGQFAAGVDLDHPVFEGVYSKDSRSRKFDAPLVYKHYTLRTENSIEQNVILKMGDQSPVLLESRPDGGGLFFTFTFFPGEDWTDFTLKSSGLAIMVQLARMMNQSQQVQQNEDLGGTGYKRIKTREKDVIKMTGKDDAEVIPEQFVQSGFIVLKFDKQNLIEGNYNLVQRDQLL
ncbi:MAG: hypothetical protein AAF570_25110, partial [Bacteroidota bacterium]